MPRTPRPIPLAELAKFLGCGVEGDERVEVEGFASLAQAAPDEMVFVRDDAHVEALLLSQARVVITTDHVKVDVDKRSVLRSAQPAFDFSRLIKEFVPIFRPAQGIAIGAHVDATATVDPTASVEPGAVVGPGSRVGPRSVVASNATLVANVEIGSDCWIHSGAVLREDTRIGDRVVLHPGVVLGADGFGLVADEMGRPVAMAQRGCVVIEDDVEIGANTTVDRATLDETRIRRGAKIDNLVQIAHNCEVGEDVLIVAQSGLSGGTVVARGAIIMAQAGTTGHLRIGEGAFVGARAGLHRDVPDGARVYGSPATEEQGWHRSMAALKRLPELLRRVRRLERSAREESGSNATSSTEGASASKTGENPASGGDSAKD